MTLADAILIAEGYFQVHHEAGAEEYFYKGDERVTGVSTRDMSRAPCGLPYVTLTSGGIKEQGEPMPEWFASADHAAQYWLFSVEYYAESVAPKNDWPKLHLYWREKPVWEAIEFVAVDQARLVNTAHPLLADAMNMKVGVVWSRLLITRLRPDGTEED